jgi:hypothetical protein
MKVMKGSLGPVQTERGYSARLFTAEIDGSPVSGTYDPTQTRSSVTGEITTVLEISGQLLAATLGPIGPTGLCGTATPLN